MINKTSHFIHAILLIAGLSACSSSDTPPQLPIPGDTLDTIDATDTTGSIAFTDNMPNTGGQLNYDYGYQLVIPQGFGEGEFTFELWFKPDNSYMYGTTNNGALGQLTNWTSEPFDPKPSDGGGWWFKGNFLLDGHSNTSALGTFSLQFYSSGRMRWHFEDSSGYYGLQAENVNQSPQLVDGNWHHVTVVRRWSGASNAQLELWVDGVLIDTQISSTQESMRPYWDTWLNFATDQEGWFWGTEKQAAIGFLDQYEDFKGLVDEVRFWTRAKTSIEIQNNYTNAVDGTETNLVGLFRFVEQTGTTSCNEINTNAVADGDCIDLINMKPGYWETENAPVN